MLNFSKKFVNAAYLTDIPIDKAGREITPISLCDEVLIYPNYTQQISGLHVGISYICQEI